MRPLAVLGLLACAVALGGLLVGRLVVTPELAAQTDLIDANLAAALSAPLHLRLAEVVLAAHLIVAATAGRWLGSRWPTSVGLVLVGLSGLHRFVILPALYGAWAKADLVASRPIEHVLTGNQLQWQETMLVGVMALLQLSLVVGAAARMAPSKPDSAPASTPATPPSATPPVAAAA